jgi:transcriptional regulator with XRE-family HTH domain
MSVRKRGVEPENGENRPKSNHERWGEELKAWRVHRQRSQEQLAKIAHCDQSWVSALEHARRVPTEDFARRMDEYLETNGVLLRQLDGVLQEIRDHHPDWFQQFSRAEAKARVIRKWQAGYIPGLLQTEEYARAIFERHDPAAATAEIEELVTARLARQQRVGRPGGPQYELLLCEEAVRRQVGGPSVMARQLRTLLQAGQLPNVTIQVLPFEIGAMAGPLVDTSLLETDDGDHFLYSESLTRGHLIRDDTEYFKWLQRYDQTRAQALNAADSARLIREILEGMINMLPARKVPGASWLKSSYSGGNGGDCVEVAQSFDAVRPVRDSKDPDGPVLSFPAPSWSAFLDGIRAGDFGEV